MTMSKDTWSGRRHHPRAYNEALRTVVTHVIHKVEQQGLIGILAVILSPSASLQLGINAN